MNPNHRTISTLLALVLVMVWSGPGLLAQETGIKFESIIPDSDNTTVKDTDGDTPAVITLHNESGKGILVEGWMLTNNDAFPDMWRLPLGTVVPANGNLTVFASGKDRSPPHNRGELHASFTYPENVPLCVLRDDGYSVVDTFSDGSQPDPGCQAPVIDRNTKLSILIPDVKHADLGTTWTTPEFTPGPEWDVGGTFGVGYEDPGLCEDLLLYHPMDRDLVTPSRVDDVSGVTYRHGYHSGPPPTVDPAQVKEGLGFPGTTGYRVVVPHDPELDPDLGDFAGSIWLFLKGDLKDRRYAVAKQSDQGAPSWAIYVESAGEVVCELVGDKGPVRVVLPKIQPESWTHVAMVVDRTANELRGFMNGSLVDKAPIDPFDRFRTSANLVYGHGPNNQTSLWQGALDEFAVWGRMLEDSEVTAVYERGLADQPVIDWPCPGTGGSLYGSLINTDVQARMKGVNTSCYIRAPFSFHDNSALVTDLTLTVNYDDAFVCYLNGVEVARRPATLPDPVEWDSAAPPRTDTLALNTETIDLTSFASLLQWGPNILAFHALNDEVDADRFVISAELCLEVGPCTHDTLGTDFWVAFLENYAEQSNNPLKLLLTLTGDPGTQGIIAAPGMGVGPIFWTIGADGKRQVSLPRSLELDGDDSIEDKGVHVLVTNGEEVGVIGMSNMLYTTDTFRGLPTDLIGTNYLVLGYPNVGAGHPATDGTCLGIVAPHDDTVVRIYPSVDTGTHPAGTVFNVTLDRGQTYQLRNTDADPADLTGTIIQSNLPVGVFGGHRCARIEKPDTFYCDLIVEQILPLETWGTHYLAAPLKTRRDYVLRILAQQDGTMVAINAPGGVSPGSSATLDRGEVFEVLVTGASEVAAEGAILVAQYATSSDQDGKVNADPFMMLLQPYRLQGFGDSSWFGSYRFCAPMDSRFENNYANVIIPTSAVSNLELDGGPLPVGTIWSAHPAAGHSWASIKMPTGTPAGHVLSNSKLTPFAVGFYGWAEYDSYGHPGDMQFGDLPPSIQCPPEVVVEVHEGVNGPTYIVPDLLFGDPPLVTVTDDCSAGGQLIYFQSPPAGMEMAWKGEEFFVITIEAQDMMHYVSCRVRARLEPSWEVKSFGEDVVADPDLEATVWGLWANPDGDRFVNLVEKVFGTDPNVPDPDSLLQYAIVDKQRGPASRGVGEDRVLRITFQRRLLMSGIDFVLEGSPDLQSWLEGPDVFVEDTGERLLLPGGEFMQFSFDVIPSSTLPKYFVRARVAVP